MRLLPSLILLLECGIVTASMKLRARNAENTNSRGLGMEAPKDCSAVVCPEGRYCTTVNEYAECVEGEAPVTMEQADAPDPCAGVECENVDEVCILQEVTCATTPCDPVPTCIENPCNAETCKEGYTCEVNMEGNVYCVMNEVFCTDEVEECTDGTTVSRDPNNDCAFDPCPDGGPSISTSMSSCPEEEPKNQDPCPESLDGVECHDDIYGGDPYCSRVCEFGKWQHMCESMGTLPTDTGLVVGEDYCTWGPDYECYESGWPSCCSDETVQCPEEHPFCEMPPPPCSGVECESGVVSCETVECETEEEICVLLEVQCVTTPCDPVPTCMENPCASMDCKEGDTCEVDSEGNGVCVEDEEELVYCTMDVHECPDGSYVSRNGSNGCAFDPCPTEPTASDACATIHCKEGYTCEVDQDGNGDCVPDGVFCTEDARECPDGSSVGRDPDNDCDFFPCSGTTDGASDACATIRCKEGYTCEVDQDGNGDCVPDGVFCTEDARECPDGSSVGRDPDNDCDFFPCSANTKGPQPCTKDAKTCPDGSMVGRDGYNNCEFHPCRPTTTTTTTTRPAFGGTINFRNPSSRPGGGVIGGGRPGLSGGSINFGMGGGSISFPSSLGGSSFSLPSSGGTSGFTGLRGGDSDGSGTNRPAFSGRWGG